MTSLAATAMKKAHAKTRACVGSKFYAGRSYASVFAQQLRNAWREAKMMAPAQISPREELRREILTLEAKERTTTEDRTRLDALSAQFARLAA